MAALRCIIFRIEECGGRGVAEPRVGAQRRRRRVAAAARHLPPDDRSVPSAHRHDAYICSRIRKDIYYSPSSFEVV